MGMAAGQPATGGAAWLRTPSAGVNTWSVPSPARAAVPATSQALLRSVQQHHVKSDATMSSRLWHRPVSAIAPDVRIAVRPVCVGPVFRLRSRRLPSCRLRSLGRRSSPPENPGWRVACREGFQACQVDRVNRLGLRATRWDHGRFLPRSSACSRLDDASRAALSRCSRRLTP
jgi:hypothetical protein